MALIKSDPSQNRTVAVLVVVLIGAIGLVFVRLRPPEAVGSAAKAKAPQAGRVASASGVAEACPFGSSRNPFEPPPGLGASMPFDEDQNEAEAAPQSTVRPVEVKPLPLPSPFRLRPSLAAPPPPAQPPRGAGPESPPPGLVLLATVRDDAGCCAVLRSDDSSVRVVQAGDRVDGGFVVVDVSEDRAVLSDGRDTIVAKRPRY